MLTEQPRPLALHSPGRAARDRADRVGRDRALARRPLSLGGGVLPRPRDRGAAQITTPGSGTLTLPSPKKRRPVALFAMLSGRFSLGVGALFAWRQSQSDAPADGPVLLAVLPFENMGDSADAYFADGMTDEVRGKLSSLPDFQVIARASSAQYRGSTKPLKDVARELGVRYLLTGTVRWVKTGAEPGAGPAGAGRGGAGAARRWAGGSAPSTPRSTTCSKSRRTSPGRWRLRSRESWPPSAMPSTSAAPTSNIAAYDEFLRGEQSYYGSSGSVSLRQALDRYEAATTLDTAFARAWSRLAMVRASVYLNADPSLANRGSRSQRGGAGDAAGSQASRSVPRAGQLSRPGSGRFPQGHRESTPRDSALAPAHAELLGALGLAEQGLGKVDDALTHMRQGLALDPRSLLYTRRLARLLNYTRQYNEAGELLGRARALAPTDPSVVLYLAMLRLSEGDLARARAVAKSIPKDASEPVIISFFSFDWSTAQLLDEEQRQLLLRLQPSQFGGNRGDWGTALAYGAYMQGNVKLMRAYADSALPSLERAVQESPDEPNNHILLGAALAYLGRNEAAMREGERAVAIRGNDGFQGPGLRHSLARIYQMVGEPVKAIEQLEMLLRVPYYVSPGYLRADPSLASLRSHPRFQRLLAEADSLAL